MRLGYQSESIFWRYLRFDPLETKVPNNTPAVLGNICTRNIITTVVYRLYSDSAHGQVLDDKLIGRNLTP